MGICCCGNRNPAGTHHTLGGLNKKKASHFQEKITTADLLVLEVGEIGKLVVGDERRITRTSGNESMVGRRPNTVSDRDHKDREVRTSSPSKACGSRRPPRRA